jgi:hypothetical protein
MSGWTEHVLEVDTPPSCWEIVTPDHSPMISYLYCGFSLLSLVPPSKCRYSTPNCPRTVYFYTPLNSLSTAHPNIQCDVTALLNKSLNSNSHPQCIICFHTCFIHQHLGSLANVCFSFPLACRDSYHISYHGSKIHCSSKNEITLNFSVH